MPCIIALTKGPLPTSLVNIPNDILGSLPAIIFANSVDIPQFRIDAASFADWACSLSWHVMLACWSGSDRNEPLGRPFVAISCCHVQENLHNTHLPLSAARQSDIGNLLSRAKHSTRGHRIATMRHYAHLRSSYLVVGSRCLTSPHARSYRW
jgi:hypothetical protein